MAVTAPMAPIRTIAARKLRELMHITSFRRAGRTAVKAYAGAG